MSNNLRYLACVEKVHQLGKVKSDRSLVQVVLQVDNGWRSARAATGLGVVRGTRGQD